MLLRCLSPLVLSASLAAQGQVHIVGPGSTTDFQDLQLAIDTAQPGDTLLLQSFTLDNSGGFTTLDKPLTLLADDGAEVELYWLNINNLPSGSFAVVRGLTLTEVTASNCDGMIFFEECEAGPWSLTSSQKSCSFLFDDCEQVAFVRCDLECDVRPLALGPYDTGVLDLVNSKVHLHRTNVSGGDQLLHVDGVPGLGIESSFLYVGASEIRGGDGDDQDCTFTPGLDVGGAGPAVQGRGGASTIAELSSSFLSGNPGQGQGGCVDGITSAPFIGVQPTVLHLRPDSHLGLRADSPVRAGSSTVLDFEGPPGFPVFLGVSTAPFALFDQGLTGSLFIAPPLLALLSVGALPPNGQLQLTIPLGPLPAGFDVIHLFAQAAYVSPAGPVVLGEASSVAWLSSSF